MKEEHTGEVSLLRELKKKKRNARNPTGLNIIGGEK